MKILVISDTHGGRANIDEVLSRHQNYDMLLFLGDGLRDLGADPPRGLVALRGNCDGLLQLGAASAALEQMIDADGFKILMMHGHEHGVKAGIERAAEYAAKRGADVLLYGHTHIPCERYFPEGAQIGQTVLSKPLHVFNPGSLGLPHGASPTFGVIEVRRGQILFSHGKI